MFQHGISAKFLRNTVNRRMYRILLQHERKKWCPWHVARAASRCSANFKLSGLSQCNSKQHIGGLWARTHQGCSSHLTKQSRNNTSGPYYDFTLVVGIQNIFEAIHTYTHLPWWSVIMILTISLRTAITVPLARKQACILAQIELLKPTVDEVSEALKHNLAVKGKRAGKTADQVNKEFQKQLRKFTYGLYKDNNCNPLKLFILPWVQMPLWIMISLALRNLSGFFPKSSSDTVSSDEDKCSLMAPGMDVEGILWFTDLTTPDSYWILPIILGLTNLANIELNALRKKEPSSRERMMTRVFRILSFGMIVVATQVPTAMTLYWVTSSSYGLVQNALIRAPKVRRFLGIPQTPSESKTPYKDMRDILKMKAEQFIKIQRP